MRIFLHMELNRELSANFIQKLIEISAFGFYCFGRDSIFFVVVVKIQNTLHYIYWNRGSDRLTKKEQPHCKCMRLHLFSFVVLCSAVVPFACYLCCLCSKIDRRTWKHFRYIVKLTCTCCEPYDMIENKLLESKSSTWNLLANVALLHILVLFLYSQSLHISFLFRIFVLAFLRCSLCISCIHS